MVVVATSSSPGRLSAGVTAAFVHQVVLESPTEEQRLAMLETLSQRLHLGMDVNLETVSKLTTVNESCRRSPRSWIRQQTEELRVYRQRRG